MLRLWLKRMAIGGGGLAAGAAVLLIVDPSGRLLMRVVAVAGMAMFALSVILMLLTFRKARTVQPLMLVISAATSVMATLAFQWLAGTALGGATQGLAVAAGLMLGIGWSLTTLMFIDGDAVRMRGTLWYLLVWALTLLLSQGVALSGLRSPHTLALMAYVGMGLAVGNSAGLIVRALRARRHFAAPGVMGAA